MKFYVVQHNGEFISENFVYGSLERALHMLESIDKISNWDVSEYCVQEFEGWATPMRWKHGEKI